MPGVTLDEAFPPTVQIALPTAGGHRLRGGSGPRVTRVALDVHAAPDVTWLAVDVAADSETEPIALPIDLPACTRVVGMTIAHEGSGPALAAARPWREALAEVHASRDPTLLAWQGTSAGEDHLVLRAAGPTTIELALALPVLAQLRLVSPGARIAATVDGGAAVSVASGASLSRPATTAAPAGDGVSAAVSLVVDRVTDRSGRAPVIHDVVMHDTWRGGATKKAILGVVELHRARLRYCYMREAQRDPRLAGTALLRFRIAPDGRVASVAVDGDLPAVVTDCLAAEVAGWEFPPDEAAVDVNYPLTFRLAALTDTSTDPGEPGSPPP